MAKAHIIMMPGLGLSSEIFDNYKFPDYKVTRLSWIAPQNDEALIPYCLRLIHNKCNKDHKHILIGHSFGGVVVQEISKFIETEKTIIISSIKSENELPGKLNLFRQFRIYGILNRTIIERSFQFWARSYGYNTVESRTLFLNSIKQQSDYYFKWATKTIVNWKNPDSDFSNIIHFHGDRDRTFPISKIKDPVVIKDGDHLMVVKKRNTINDAILNSIRD